MSIISAKIYSPNNLMLFEICFLYSVFKEIESKAIIFDNIRIKNNKITISPIIKLISKETSNAKFANKINVAIEKKNNYRFNNNNCIAKLKKS